MIVWNIAVRRFARLRAGRIAVQVYTVYYTLMGAWVARVNMGEIIELNGGAGNNLIYHINFTRRGMPHSCCAVFLCHARLIMGKRNDTRPNKTTHDATHDSLRHWRQNFGAPVLCVFINIAGGWLPCCCW